MNIIKYQSPSGAEIYLTQSQISALAAAGVWPRDFRGQEYCSVSEGWYEGYPTYSDAELAREFGL